MKKIIILAAVIVLVFACSRKTVVITEAKTPGQTNDNSVSTKEEMPLADSHTPGSIVVKKDTAIRAEDLLAAGKTVYEVRCIRCHDAKPVQNFTAQQWTEILKSMIPKSRLNEAQAKQVTAYVMANAKK